MYFGAPQIILSALYVMALGVSLVKHGQPKTGEESFWYTFAAVVIVFALLFWGGFFQK